MVIDADGGGEPDLVEIDRFSATVVDVDDVDVEVGNSVCSIACLQSCIVMVNPMQSIDLPNPLPYLQLLGV